jgi:pimeloyl-ACP methyl ester carboxylesterase
MRFLYIHGFASSPQSRKAQHFQSTLASRNIPIDIPAMDQGDFEHLTISGQLHVLEQAINREPVCLIGSSMGGFLAALYASMYPEVARLVLLAPAFRFAQRWRQTIGQPPPSFFEVFHHGDKRVRRVHYGLIEDALKFPPEPDFAQPALIFHGIQDDVAPIEYSRAFAASHPNARLAELDSGHELLEGADGTMSVPDRIVTEAVAFLLD